MSNNRGPNRQNKIQGFKLFRKQANLDFPDDFRDEFLREFDGHILYPNSTNALDVVRRRETMGPIARSIRLSAIPLARTILTVVAVGPPQAECRIDLAPARLQFIGPQNEG